MPDEAKEMLSEALDNNGKVDVQNALWLKLAKHVINVARSQMLPQR